MVGRLPFPKSSVFWPWQRTANRPAATDTLAEPVEEGVSIVHRVLSRMMRWWGGKVVRHPYKILSVFGVATVAFTVCATMLGDPDSATGNPNWPKSHRAPQRFNHAPTPRVSPLCPRPSALSRALIKHDRLPVRPHRRADVGRRWHLELESLVNATADDGKG